MNIYSVYHNPQKPDEERLILITEGFSILAAIFPWYVLFTKKRFQLGIIAIFIGIIIHIIKLQSYQAGFSLSIIYMILTGWFMSDFYEYILERDGYKLKDIILADSYEKAELNYYIRAKDK